MRTDVDDASRSIAPSGLTQERLSLRHKTEWCDHIDFMQFMPDRWRRCRKIGVRDYAAYPGIVDENIQPPPQCDSLSYEPAPIGISR
jgi:hypothetical protein